MKSFLFVLLIGISFVGCKKDSEPTANLPITYKLNLTINGEGEVDIIPLKSSYDEGENVTLHAYPDTLCEFKGWEGSILSSENPYLLKMDGDKNIIALFERLPKTYEPDISGKWGGVQYLVDLELNQTSIYDSTITGSMSVVLTTGDTLNYTVYGHNIPPNVTMDWNKAGYYQIHYTGQWEGNSTIKGVMEENGVEYDLDFVKVSGQYKMGIRARISFSKRPNN